ncbi:MAG: hypothetical protein WC325_09610 [Candidatus Bathyarchaeia archaeon]|jgi:hypothetical protein
MALDTQKVLEESNRVASDVAGRYGLSFTPANVPSTLQAPTQGENSSLSFPQSMNGLSGSDAILAGVKSTLDSITSQLKQSQTTDKPQALATAEQEQSSIFDKLKDASSKLLGIGTRKTQLEQEAGVDENTKKLQENQLAIASKLAEYEASVKSIEGLNVAKPFQDIERERAARTYASEVGVLEAYGNALRGNLELAQNRISQVLQNEFQSTQQEIDNLKTFYEINKDILTGEESKYAEQIKADADEKEAQLKQKQTDAKNNTELFLEVAKNGGSSSVIDFNLPYEENLKRAAPYVGALDRAREARLAGESSGVIAGETSFDDVILQSIANGASPLQAARDAAATSENSGIQVDQKLLQKLSERASAIKSEYDKQTEEQNKKVDVALSEVEKDIQELSMGGILSGADIRSALKSRGYKQKEIDDSSVGTVVGKVGSTASSFFSSLFQ